MWLLDSSTLELQDFPSQKILHYAILSHTWGDSEVSFQDMRSASKEIRQTGGYAKVKRCYEQAVSDGFDFV